MNRTFAILIAFIIASAHVCAWARQDQPAAAAPASDAKPAMSQPELDQLVAPIALYPDSLVSQILMASTYPLEIVQADRWVKENPSVTGDALASALNEETWDASVKSLTGFPDVLDMMNEDVDWTTRLGDAFLGQQEQVLDTVQQLRTKAKDAGNLESTEQQVVEVQNTGGTEVIVIESSSPEVIYVPRYDPVVVYGTWPYPAYPPRVYYPPGYVAGTAALAFGVGVARGAAWGWAWGGCNWGRGNVDIDIDRNVNFNRDINRTSIRNDMNARGLGEGRGEWKHDRAHRQGVSYRDNATAKKHGRGGDAREKQAREKYRGRAEAGRRDIDRGGASEFKGRGGANRGGAEARPGANRGGAEGRSGANRGGAEARSGANRGSAQKRTGGQNRSSSSRAGSSAFGGSHSGSRTRAASSRGSSSRAKSGRSGGGRSSRGGGGRRR